MPIPYRVQSRWSRTLLLLLVLAVPIEVEAQARTGADSMYVRAHGLVAQGRGDAGRAIVDSMLRATAPGTAEHAEGLFWRASVSKRAEDAERDYLRIVIEYPLSPRAEEALIRLAEMEMIRGDRTRAQRHLQRLVVEHPSGPSRARASYWLARIFFEANELTRGCHELNTARTRAAPMDIELRNQLEYQVQRCIGVDLGPAPASPTPAQQPPAAVPTPTPPAPPRAAPSVQPTQPTTRTPTPPSAQSTGASKVFTVQAAAFPAREAADSFMESLKAKGYDVRVWGTESPFRVRIGRFATRAEANAMAAELRAKMISTDAWVTEAEVR